ncbi:MAG: hypothetical protein AAF411_04120 [Myxococcota bacterium]
MHRGGGHERVLGEARLQSGVQRLQARFELLLGAMRFGLSDSRMAGGVEFEYFPPRNGLRIVPDELWIPVVVLGSGRTPSEAGQELLKRVQNVESVLSARSDVVAEGSVRQRAYKSWTEKLAGVRQGRVRHHAQATAIVVYRLHEGADFAARIALLESVRGKLAEFERSDGAYAVGAASWRAHDPERFRDRLVASLLRRLRSFTASHEGLAPTFGGSLGLSVVTFGPTEAYVSLDAHVTLRPIVPTAGPEGPAMKGALLAHLG